MEKDNSNTFTVVLIDDSPLTHLIVEKALDEIDFAVLLAHIYNGEEFVELVKRTHPDLAILDIEMTGIDGFTAMDSARRFHPDLKVIFLSQYNTQGFITAARKANANGFLVKMPSVETLKDALIRVMKGEFVEYSSIEQV
ncbi:MAG: response regulator transcription factor [Candidatus Kapabacteria bacterium]|nr:response regulator transcription factor [Ignavibacteriota bacterium]MCW5884694.1 response regulator transcription factor [Candidatus Kapabacteria bacterium]